MLAITRRENESLQIYPSSNLDPDTTIAELFKDGPIEIHVSKVQGNQVRLSLKAPRSLTIMRTELHQPDTADQPDTALVN